MKVATILATAAVMTIGLANAADVFNSNKIEEVEMPTPDQALKAVHEIELPPNVKLTGTTQPMQMVTNKEGDRTVTAIDPSSDKHEQFWGGGWGGFGPYRFGYSCGGFGGWAYPLGFWNTFGAGIWGGGCGLGIPYGGLFYC